MPGMDQRTNDITEAAMLEDVAPAAPDSESGAPASVVVGDAAAAAGLVDELTDDMSAAEVLDVTRRHVERIAELDPADVVGPAAEIAEVLGRLIEEDER